MENNNILTIIKIHRPNLSENSLKTYNSTLVNLYYSVYPNDKLISSVKFFNFDDFINFLKDTPYNKRKSKLSALVVITNSNKENPNPYQTLMMEDIHKWDAEQKKQIINPDTEQISQEEVKTILKKYEEVFNSKTSSIQDKQDYIILCLSSGAYIPPRRSLDWCELKFKNINKDTDNFIKTIGGKFPTFVLNKYKTNKSYGTTLIKIPPELVKILKKWLAIIKPINTETILFDKNMNPLTAVKFTQRLNKIFNGKISVNALRHSYTTEKYEDVEMPPLEEIEETAKLMGHSLTQHLEYIKK